MKTYFLIDLENVNKKEHFEGCEKISKDDEVIVFYSKDSLSMDLDIISKLNKPDIYKVEKGKKGDQSLDKHLLSYLGFLIGHNFYNKDIIYVILSKDLGYDLIGDFWKAKGNYKIVRKESFGEYFGIKHVEPVKIKEEPVKIQEEPEKKDLKTENLQEVKDEKKTINISVEIKEDVLKEKREVKTENLQEVKDEKKTTNTSTEIKQDVLKEKRDAVLSILKANLDEKVIGKEKKSNILNFAHNHIKEKGKIYLELVKALKQEKGLAVYNLIKKKL